MQRRTRMGAVAKTGIWLAFIVATVMPVILAARSPLLAWRDEIYIAAGFAGIIALVLMLLQPLLALGVLPGLTGSHGRRVHRWVGGLLVLAVMIHVAGLWITSPPDVVDALLFVSPAPFSAWGVVAMWGVCCVVILVALRRRVGLRPRAWRIGHMSLAVIIVLGSVGHALQIEGTMEPISKAILCALLLGAGSKIAYDLRALIKRPTRP